MKSSTVLLAMGLTMLIALPCAGDVKSKTDITHTTLTDGESGPKYLSFTVPTPEAPRATSITYAELRFESKLEPGVEVELWEDSGDGLKPWEAEIKGQRCLWVADKRSGGLVRFDVTDIVRSWVGGMQNNGFLIRLVPEQDEKDLILAKQPKISLLYHEVAGR